MSLPQQQSELTVDYFDYELPPELIAQHPPAQRTDSRLLYVAGEVLRDLSFADLPQLLAPRDLLVFNDTKVIKARLHGTKQTGGRVEVLVERVLNAHEVLAHVRASKSPRPGTLLRLADAFDAETLGRTDDLFHLRFDSSRTVFEWLEQYGHVPLPPYIAHPDGPEDAQRYQTVYAAQPGAVAAPTAGLHFDETMLERLRAQGVGFAFVTLHVGAGTFQPVRVKRLAEHRMHREWYSIPEATAAAIERTRTAGGRIVAVGTTSLRALESAATPDGRVQAGSGETELFITPGYRFRVVERLLTNFHLPRSTLLMLVSAFAGMETIRRAYRHAVERRYRFFSYGDAMFLERLNT
ncbi:MAG: tRNA preQ1(34) S-adenosylmethionine ribosyltransferase-isomerase QueA [Pseudomonadota bacterium]